MEIHILREGVLNDNELHIADKGKIFKGGYIAIINEYFFATSWSNNLKVKKFKKINSLQNYLEKNYSTEELENLILN